MRYACLDDVPLPEKFLGHKGQGILDEGITPLVRAVIAHEFMPGLFCEGHLHQRYESPYVQLFQDDFRLLSFLTGHFNKTHNTDWGMNGNVLVHRKEAFTLEYLVQLQSSSKELAQFLFDYRPEVLDPAYVPLRIPINVDKTTESHIMKLYDEVIALCERDDQSPEHRKRILSRMDLLEELREKQCEGPCYEIAPFEEQRYSWLRKAESLLGK